MCSNYYIIIITLIKISKRSVEHENNKILESWKKKLYGLVFFHSAMSICIFLQRLGPCLVLKNILYFVFIFENEYSFSESQFRIKNPFSFLPLFGTCFKYKIWEEKHWHTRFSLGSYFLFFLKSNFFTYKVDLSETGHSSGLHPFSVFY